MSIYIYLQLGHTITVGRGRGEGYGELAGYCYSLPVTSQLTAVTAHKHNWPSSHSFQQKTMHHSTSICCTVFDVQDHCEFSVAYLSGSGVASNKINNTKGRNLTLKSAYLSQQLLSHKIFTLLPFILRMTEQFSVPTSHKDLSHSQTMKYLGAIFSHLPM